MKIKIAIGADHAGFPYKQPITEWLIANNFEVTDFGTHSAVSVDYPDFAHPVAVGVENGDFKFGVLMCGSGEGVCMTANKHAGVRAALVWRPDVALLTRQHNDANVICLPVRFISLPDALEMVRIFLNTAFEAGRHATRVGKMAC